LDLAEEGRERWRKLHNADLPYLFFSLNIMMMNSKEVICGDTTQDAWGDVKCIQAFGEET